MKLVINSNMRYAVPLSCLIESLINVGWKRLDELVIVRGGATQDRVGKRLIREITTLKSTNVTITYFNCYECETFLKSNVFQLIML